MEGISHNTLLGTYLQDCRTCICLASAPREAKQMRVAGFDTWNCILVVYGKELVCTNGTHGYYPMLEGTQS